MDLNNFKDLIEDALYDAIAYRYGYDDDGNDGLFYSQKQEEYRELLNKLSK